MISRTTTSTVSFAYPFEIDGYINALPAGDYELVVDEELLQNLSFVSYLRTATYIMIKGNNNDDSIQMHRIDPDELELILSLDQKRSSKPKDSEAALSPSEDLK